MPVNLGHISPALFQRGAHSLIGRRTGDLGRKHQIAKMAPWSSPRLPAVRALRRGKFYRCLEPRFARSCWRLEAGEALADVLVTESVDSLTTGSVSAELVIIASDDQRGLVKSSMKSGGLQAQNALFASRRVATSDGLRHSHAYGLAIVSA